MKKLNRSRITAAGIIAGAMIASSNILTGCNENVYGPPPDIEVEENIPETVYGPPEDFSEVESIGDENVNEQSSISYSVEDNQLEDVYGPPVESYSAEENLIEGVYGPPSDFDAAENIEPPVYGPPEDNSETPVTPTASADPSKGSD